MPSSGMTYVTTNVATTCIMTRLEDTEIRDRSPALRWGSSRRSSRFPSRLGDPILHPIDAFSVTARRLAFCISAIGAFRLRHLNPLTHSTLAPAVLSGYAPATIWDVPFHPREVPPLVGRFGVVYQYLVTW